MFALKQFCHYLLGRPFKLVTDHAPLQWLSIQKIEGMLCRWALAMQEYSFYIEYHRGSLNSNADALSRRVLHTTVSAATQIPQQDTKDELRQAQQNDTIIRKLADALKHPNKRPSGNIWKSSPLSQYHQLWPQLTVVDGVVCRKYSPEPTKDIITVPIVPTSLCKSVLIRKPQHP